MADDDVVHLPADTDPHARGVIAWPSLATVDHWQGHLGAARDAVAEVARAIARFEPVTVLVDDGELRAAEAWLGHDAAIDAREVPGVPQRLRAEGPLPVIDLDGRPLALVPDGPAGATARAIADELGLAIGPLPWAWGGSVLVSDGDLTALCVEGSMAGTEGQAEAETELARFGFERVVWLPGGRTDGPTGAVDGLVAATGPGRVLLQGTTDPADPDHDVAAECRAVLELAGLEVVLVDVLPHVECFDTIVEVPYVDVYVANGGVVVPLAGAAADTAVLAAISAAYPGREVVGVPGRVLSYGGYGLRGITLPVPAPRV